MNTKMMALYKQWHSYLTNEFRSSASQLNWPERLVDLFYYELTVPLFIPSYRALFLDLYNLLCLIGLFTNIFYFYLSRKRTYFYLHHTFDNLIIELKKIRILNEKKKIIRMTAHAYNINVTFKIEEKKTYLEVWTKI